MRVKDYDYNDDAEGIISPLRKEELINEIEMVRKKDSVAHYEILKIGQNDVEFEFLYDYLEEKGVQIRGISPTLEEIKEFERVSVSGINYYNLPKAMGYEEQYALFDKLQGIRKDRQAKGENYLEDNEYKKIRSQIATGNLRLAKYMTTLMPFRNVNIESDDLLGYAYRGLSDAIDKFDHTRGFKFSTYAWFRIYRSIERGIAAEYGINNNLYLEYRELIDVKQLYFEETGREPTISDLQFILGFTENKIESLMRFDKINIHAESIEEKIYEGNAYEKIIDEHSDSGKIDSLDDGEYYEDGIILNDGQKEYDIIDEKKSVEKIAEEEWLKDKISEILVTLKPRDAEVLRMMFGMIDGEPKSLGEVAKNLNVTKERIRQIKVSVLRDIKFRKNVNKDLKEFKDN